MPMRGRVTYLIAYDIASDGRRQAVAEVLSAYGPRVQFSVFEAELTDKQYAVLVATLEDLTDELQDQVRIYPAPVAAKIVGSRTLEERSSYWIVSTVPIS